MGIYITVSDNFRFCNGSATYSANSGTFGLWLQHVSVGSLSVRRLHWCIDTEGQLYLWASQIVVFMDSNMLFFFFFPRDGSPIVSFWTLSPPLSIVAHIVDLNLLYFSASCNGEWLLDHSWKCFFKHCLHSGPWRHAGKIQMLHKWAQSLYKPLHQQS